MPYLQRRWSTFLIASLLVMSFILYQRQKLVLHRIDDYHVVTGGNGGAPVYTDGMIKSDGAYYTRTLVMGRLTTEDASWVEDDALNVNTSVYVVDMPNGGVPANKGHEAMAYLTYIIDHYDNLSDTTLFFHAHPEAWHNNVLLDMSSAKTVQRLSSARVEREGYMNSRCHHDPGCPNWIHVDRPEAEWDLATKGEEPYFTSTVWKELHGDAPIPPAISQPCCSQFAVSRDRIRSVPISRYEHIRNWLLTTGLFDGVSGRIMEYTWQLIFTDGAEFCPPIHECYCDGYGICFGGATELQDWLDKLKEKEVLIDEYNSMILGGKGDGDEELDKLKQKMAVLDEALNSAKAMAISRGEDPRNRAIEAGRQWNDGDGF